MASKPTPADTAASAGSGGRRIAARAAQSASQTPASTASVDDEQLAAALESLGKTVDEASAALLATAAARIRQPVAVDAFGGDIPLFVDGTVHVARKGKLHVVEGGVLVAETDLAPAEIDELTAMRVVRVATTNELRDAALRARG